MTKILFVAGEATPFIKTGGLADVIGSLPKALQAEKLDISVILPKYSQIPSHFKEEMETIYTGEVKMSWRRQYCGLQHLEHDGIHFYFIDNEYYFDRYSVYGEYDDGERFSFFCKAVLEVLPHLPGGVPDVLHCHDWHSGAIAPLYRFTYAWKEDYRNIKIIYTIHNLKYQGIFPLRLGYEFLELPGEALSENGMEFYGNCNFMKGGIAYADHITTVSETYAEEITYEYFGEGLDGLLRQRKNDLWGIVNGIDYDEYNPGGDDYVPAFTWRSPKRKLKLKEELQADLGLEVDKKIPLIAMITRIVDQKGFDLLGRVMEEVLELPLQLAILGVGTEDYEGYLRYCESQYPQKLTVNLFFDNVLARRLYAASDMFLMPSRFEPCGIGQLIAMRYGSLPVVRCTGGLADTVEDANFAAGTGTGFLFYNYNAHDMLYCIEDAVEQYRENEKGWYKIVKNAMRQDFSWDNSAKRYAELYDLVTSF